MPSFIDAALTNSPTAKGLKYVLHKSLRREDPMRSHKHTHASAITAGGVNEFCPRMYAIMDNITLDKQPAKWIDTSLAMTFEIGKAVQDIVVNKLSDEGAAITNWKCANTKCGHLAPRCKRPVECPDCGCAYMKPDEIRLLSTVSHIGGGFDVFGQLGEDKLRLVEIKTMAPEEFKGLVAPLAEHRARTNLYLRLVEESDDPWKSRINTKQGIILYCSKGGFGCLDMLPMQWGLFDRFSPFKEFRVERDDTKTEAYTAKGKAVKDYRDGTIGMPCGICPTAFTKRAMACPVKEACFSGKFPAAQ
jgi:hypothetical protein